MKMRKILPLVILAVGALFVLSGCDAMLDAIFDNSQLFVSVRVSNTFAPLDYAATYTYGTNAGRVQVKLTDLSTLETTSATTYWTSISGGYVYYDINFTGLKGDSYQVDVKYADTYDGSGITSTTYGAPVTPKDSTGRSASIVIYY